MKPQKHLIIPAEKMVWSEGLYEKTEMCYLWADEATGKRAFLLKMHPGSMIPQHDHPQREIAWLLEGEVRLGEDYMKAGDFLTAGLGESHDVYTETGCLFFLYIDQDSTGAGDEA
ncbi:cupin domain-containing protein [Brevibacillus fulvus]|uniref:Anti-sigma factor ChrR (Cupin superfamily) n=1 Tax=Brevibacillus fulvus TaxID=1125967 RepID=A0A939BRQ0_9BACL|nr:cupin domain-containing protein [Brevibacillus fulvus]MBM7589683.1 anti-sigma factor ChrR (cupin superfamily) [Brevibacillus fulvus]